MEQQKGGKQPAQTKPAGAQPAKQAGRPEPKPAQKKAK